MGVWEHEGPYSINELEQETQSNEDMSKCNMEEVYFYFKFVNEVHFFFSGWPWFFEGVKRGWVLIGSKCYE